ncbi:hypothetical protein [Cryobacterium sp. M15]|uniref:hypothetical protein n=1 Tax=Cryobacterium sp. M15 TaxID=2048291 RepID=UPI000CE52B1F|nr:hypothetical protein [Cryobacterium sp. M15]
MTDDLSAWMSRPQQVAREDLTPYPLTAPVTFVSSEPRLEYQQNAPTDRQLLDSRGVPLWRVTVTGGLFGDKEIRVRIASELRPACAADEEVEMVNFRYGRTPNRAEFVPYFVADAVHAAPLGLDSILGEVE